MERVIEPTLRRPMRARLLVLPGVMAWALVVRLHGLDAMSMWMDELRQVGYYGGGWRTIMYNAAAQAQTPLDYWVGRCVMAFGDSDFVLRLPAAICGTLAVLATFLVGRRLLSPAAAGLAAVLVASAPYAIHYSQEARPYAIFWCLQLLTLLALSRAWRRNGLTDWAVVALCLAACLLSRTLAPLAFSAGIVVWSGIEVCRGRRARRRTGARPPVSCWRRRSVRLWIILVALWIPVLQLLLYIVRVQRRRAYLAGELAEALNWQENLSTIGHIAYSWFVFTLPIGVVIIPLALWGVVLAWRLPGRRGREARMLIISVGGGYLVHVGAYVVLVAGIEPKHVYWAYMLPFVAIAAAHALENLAGRIRGAGAAVWCRAVLYFAVACALMTMAWVDRRQAVFDKPDWRAAAQCLGASLDDVDVAFYHNAVPFGSYRPAFMAAPHYWPIERAIVDIADAPAAAQRITNAGTVRVGVMMRCPREIANDHETWQRRGHDAGLEVHCFDQFVVLVSAVPRPAVRAFDEMTAALLHGLSGATAGPVEIHAARAAMWRALGDTAQAGAEIGRARLIIGRAHAAQFEHKYGEIAPPIALGSVPLR